MTTTHHRLAPRSFPRTAVVGWWLVVATTVLLSFHHQDVHVHAAKEPRTGIGFPDIYKGSSLTGVGVRTKGPIKVYAVGQYDHDTFLLKMNYGIGAEKMSSALVDALSSRCRSSDALQEFTQTMMRGLPNGAPKGTNLEFKTKGGTLTLSVNGNKVGSISSKPLATAFCGIYTDSKAVCLLHPPTHPEEHSTTNNHGSFSFSSIISGKKVFGTIAAPNRVVATAVGAALGYGLGSYLPSPKSE